MKETLTHHSLPSKLFSYPEIEHHITYTQPFTLCKLHVSIHSLSIIIYIQTLKKKKFMLCCDLTHTHLRCCLFKAIRVQGGHDVDSGIVDQLDNCFIPFLVLIAQVLGQKNEQLPSNSFIAMHIPNVFKFRLT